MSAIGNITRNAFLVGCAATGLFAPFAGANAATDRVLYSFTGATGQNPQASMIRDKAGNLYGTTVDGGMNNLGTVFRLARDGTETVLLSFNSNGGANPYDRLTADKVGNLYGTGKKWRHYESMQPLPQVASR
jgi:uncharacterized repeat protein (TIGR03803 family)